MRSVLGVDVGGTKVAAGPVSRAGAELAPCLVEPSRGENAAVFLEALEDTLRRALVEFKDFNPSAIGLACAGTVDVQRGVVVSSPNLPLREIPLAAALRDALDIPVFLENDANAAALGEAVAGAGRGLRHVVMLTLGTGVGGGLFLDGRIYHGTSGGAGELGHMVVQRDGLACGCGHRGCLEAYASGPALVRYAAAHAGQPEWDPENALLSLKDQGRLTGGAVGRLAAAGHPGAVSAVRQLAEWLGVGLVSITNIFDPQMIVVGGGVGELGELLVAPAREHVRTGAMPPGRDLVEITCAKLGNKAGLVGAGLVAWAAVESVPG